MSSDIAYGLKGIVAGETKITEVDFENGKLYFRGYDIEELAAHSTFEEVFWLLVTGELPKKHLRTWFRGLLTQDRRIITSERRELNSMLDHAFLHQPLLALANFVTSRGALTPTTRDAKILPQKAMEVGTELCAVFPTVIAHLIRWGQSPPRFANPKDIYIQPHPKLSHAANFLWLLRGEEYPTKAEEKALDIALILHADHEFNASTFNGVRGAASTGATPHACIVAGLGVLSGPNHGGANEMAMRMFEDIKHPDQAAKWIVEYMVNKKQRVFGFGHRLYKHRDPRTEILKPLSKKLCEARGLPWYAIASKVEDITREILTSRGREDLPPNIDFYSPVLFAALGIPAMYMPLIFAMGRIAGWTAHMKEQYEHNMLTRPLAKYTGPASRPYPEK